MRVLLWLFIGPTLALLALGSLGVTAPGPALGASLGAQAVTYLLRARVGRARLAAALRRYRHQPGATIMRGRLSLGESIAQGLLWVTAAGLATAAFLVGAA
jgi:hypothetical protein